MKRLVLIALCLAGLSSAAAAKALDTTPRIAVMSAIAPEWQALLRATSNQKVHQIGGTRFVTGELSGKNVVLFLSGVSMVNAAMTAQQAIDHFQIKAIVFSGIAGGVNPALGIGDVAVAEQWGAYLESVMARETDGAFTPPKFSATPYPNFGMIFPTYTKVTRDGNAPRKSASGSRWTPDCWPWRASLPTPLS